MKSDILLSICIPTYNRSRFLEISLESIMNQIKDNDSIEIIVSDNGSPDNTLEVISKYLDHSKFKFIKHTTNLGPIKNGIEIIKNYARGEYCWYIGDDDYVVQGAVSKILDVLKNNREVDFFYVDIDNYELDNQNIEIENTLLHIMNKDIISTIDYVKLNSFEELLLPSYSDLFLGEIMASIFRREIWLREIDIYNYIHLEYLSTLETAYTHCVIFAKQFMGSNAIYISTPLIIVDNRAREWSAKAHYIIVEHLLSLLKLYRENGLSDAIFFSCIKHYVSLTLPVVTRFLVNKKLPYRGLISYDKYFMFLISHPFITFLSVCAIVKRRVVQLFRKN
jgi:glycosyltransferase involved in cell wall biosynthesis